MEPTKPIPGNFNIYELNTTIKYLLKILKHNQHALYYKACHLFNFLREN